MAPYMIAFALSVLLCAIAEHILLRSKRAGIPFLGLSVLVPVILAGARDYTVGTDIRAYGNFVFESAVTSRSMFSFVLRRSDIEPVYRLLAFLVSRFTDNPHWFYFFTALIICGCTMGGLLYYRRYCSITLGWACFLFLFYGDTLNTMRQCLALGVIFMSFPLFLKRKYIPFAVLQAVGILFHMTGVIALLLPVLYLLMEKIPPRWIQFYFVIGCMVLILFYSPVLRLILQNGLLPAKFYRYISRGVAFALNPTILRLPFLIPILFFYDRFCDFDGPYRPSSAAAAAGAGIRPSSVSADREKGIRGGYPLGMFIVIMLLLEICTVQLRSVRPTLYRISYYFGYYRFIAYPRLVRVLRRDNRLITTAVLFLYLVVLWYYQNVIQGNNEIYPYVYSPGWYVP